MRVIEFFDHGVSLDPGAVAFMRHDGTEAMTYAEVQEATHRIAAALHRDGLGEGDQVAVLSPNDPLVMPCVLGIMRAGCRWVALNATSSTDELAAMLALVGARMLVHAPQAAASAAQLRERVPGLERLVALRVG
ncbi:MAG: acyl--CoA ligase, partial [Streptomyces sp.]|nr:acyl--CoA ligase [Streptomyces sp.]